MDCLVITDQSSCQKGDRITISGGERNVRRWTKFQKTAVLQPELVIAATGTADGVPVAVGDWRQHHRLHCCYNPWPCGSWHPLPLRHWRTWNYCWPAYRSILLLLASTPCPRLDSRTAKCSVSPRRCVPPGTRLWCASCLWHGKDVVS